MLRNCFEHYLYNGAECYRKSKRKRRDASHSSISLDQSRTKNNTAKPRLSR